MSGLARTAASLTLLQRAFSGQGRSPRRGLRGPTPRAGAEPLPRPARGDFDRRTVYRRRRASDGMPFVPRSPSGWRTAPGNHVCSGRPGVASHSNARSTTCRIRSNHHCARSKRCWRRRTPPQAGLPSNPSSNCAVIITRVFLLPFWQRGLDKYCPGWKNVVVLQN